MQLVLNCMIKWRIWHEDFSMFSDAILHPRSHPNQSKSIYTIYIETRKYHGLSFSQPIVPVQLWSIIFLHISSYHVVFRAIEPGEPGWIISDRQQSNWRILPILLALTFKKYGCSQCHFTVPQSPDMWILRKHRRSQLQTLHIHTWLLISWL